jgi:hypothetical protein
VRHCIYNNGSSYDENQNITTISSLGSSRILCAMSGFTTAKKSQEASISEKQNYYGKNRFQILECKTNFEYYD